MTDLNPLLKNQENTNIAKHGRDKNQETIKTITQIAEELKNSAKKVQLIYAFNGVGKTRLLKEINISSHSKHAGEEVSIISDGDRRMLKYLVEKINEIYNIKINNN